MLKLWKKAAAPGHEELFIRHYGQLYAWAVRLTDQDRQRALQVSLNFNQPGADLQMVYQCPAASPETAAVPLTLLRSEESFAGAEAEAREAEEPPQRFLTALGSGRRRLFDLRFWLRPGVITATVSVILIAALLLCHLPERKVTAAELLRRAAVSEASLASRADLALHRTLSLEERDPVSGRIIARRRVEVWQSNQQGVNARRLYDERDQLIAGDWRGADGARTIYRRGAKPDSQPNSGSSSVARLNPPASIPASIEDAWQLELATSDFVALLEDASRAVAEETPTTHVISWQMDTDAVDHGSSARLVKATLVLSKPDLRPVEQRLLVERGGQAREYRFLETKFDRYAQELVPPAIFQPEAELLGATGGELSPAPLPLLNPRRSVCGVRWKRSSGLPRRTV